MSTKACRFLLLVAFIGLLFRSCTSNKGYEYKQMKDLKGAMYSDMKYSRACIKLLNELGPQGCEAAGQTPITAPLLHSNDSSQIPKGQRVVVVVPAPEADSFLQKLLSDTVLRSQVVGVLIDPTAGRPRRSSVAPKFPGADYAPYAAKGYVWNPAGTGFNRQWFGIPIYYLTQELAADIGWRTEYNAKHELRGGRHVARMVLPMQAEGNSTYCIKQRTCLPVGSYSVVSSLTPLPYPTTATSTPITLLLTQMDGNALVHDIAQASSSLSGLIAGLVAVTALSQSGLTANYNRQLVFAALAGEAFDYMGSRRLLYEISRNGTDTTSVLGLELNRVDQVLEVGQVGAALNPASNTSTFYLHTQPGFEGNTSALVAAAQAAAAVEGSHRLSALPASPTNPGVPPSSLMNFLREKVGQKGREGADIAGMVLADFDTAFRNPNYQSEWDDGGNVSSTTTITAMVDASVLLARTLHSLLSNSTPPAPLPLNRTVLNDLTTQLYLCLMRPVPGMYCGLVSQLMRPDRKVSYDGSTSVAVDGYPGVLSFVHLDPKSSYFKPNLPRFLFNYLGNLTAAPLPPNATKSQTTNNTNLEGDTCDPNIKICSAPLACIGWRYSSKDESGMGHCRNTTTNYVPAYSTRLKPTQSGWLLDDSAVSWGKRSNWPDDPIWTESNWPAQTPTLTIFQRESRATQIICLVVGLLLTAGTGALSWAGVKAFEQHHKRA